MTEIKEHAPGTFCWAELGTTEAEKAKPFYAELFGWSYVDEDVGADGTYTRLQLDGRDVAGMYQLDGDQRAGGVPPNWASYVSVANADSIARRAESLGGKVLLGPRDAHSFGRKALIQDPMGATFSVWQPKARKGSTVAEQPGTPGWNELTTTNVDVAGRFYCHLFGWGTKIHNGGSHYVSFTCDDRAVGGMLQMSPEWGDLMPHWMVYFTVEDCDKMARWAERLGGQVKIDPTDIPEVGRFCVLQDPQGALFSVITWLH